MLATRCTRCIKRRIDLFPTWMRLTKVCLIRCPYLSSWMMWPFEVIWNKTFCLLLLLLYASFFSWCAAPVLLFSALPRSLTFPLLHDYVCTYNTAGLRARAASIIYFLFFFFWLLSRSSLPVLRRPACVPGSKTCAVWACQHALLFSSLPLPI